MAQMIVDLLGGLAVSVEIFVFTLLIALPLGFLIAFGRMSRNAIVSAVFRGYISVVRGTPLMLQIMFIYFAPYMFFGLPLSNYPRILATILAFSFNYAAYFAEIFRGGMMSIPVGQHEAGQVLGLTRMQTFFHVVLPQVVKRVLLPVSNEVITLVKDTSLANIIAVGELFRAAKNEASRTASVEPLFVAGLFYLLMNGVVTLVFSYLTRRMDYYKD